MRYAVFAASDEQWASFEHHIVQSYPEHQYTRIEREYDLRGLRIEKVV
jgi:hypothetical protein